MRRESSQQVVFLTQREVADLIQVPVRTIEYWRLVQTGPPYLKLGAHVRYEHAEVLAWARGHRHG